MDMHCGRRRSLAEKASKYPFKALYIVLLQTQVPTHSVVCKSDDEERDVFSLKAYRTCYPTRSNHGIRARGDGIKRPHRYRIPEV